MGAVAFDVMDCCEGRGGFSTLNSTVLSANDFVFLPEKQQHHLPSATHVQFLLFAVPLLLSSSNHSLWHMQFDAICWVTEIPLCNWSNDSGEAFKGVKLRENEARVIVPRLVVNEPHNERGGVQGPRLSKADIENEIRVRPCVMQGRQRRGFRDFGAAWGYSTEHLHARSYSPAVFFKNLSSPALQLAQPPFDLSFEAERMFTRNPQWNKLAVCTQPSVQPQFTPRGEGHGGRNLQNWHQKNASAPSQTIATT